MKLRLLLQSLLWLSAIYQVIPLALTRKRKSAWAEWQDCVSPEQILQKASFFDEATPDSESLINLALVRLSKMLLTESNSGVPQVDFDHNEHFPTLEKMARMATTSSRISADSNTSVTDIESRIESTKAFAIILRILWERSNQHLVSGLEQPIVDYWQKEGPALIQSEKLAPHQLSALQWSSDMLTLIRNDKYHNHLDEEYLLGGQVLRRATSNLPFRIRPALLRDFKDLTVNALRQEVNFRVDTIRTVTDHVVRERRQTAWQADAGIRPFCYAGKSMSQQAWSPLVLSIRDALQERLGEYFDGCLLNLYPNGQSGMRYHIDPDQGVKWDFDTVVVSVGSTRRFSFRALNSNEKPHNFAVFHGDVVHMFADCQLRYQHTVKKADNRAEMTPRVSLVFKRTLNRRK